MSLLQIADTSLGIPMISADWDLPVRLLVDLACVLILVRGIYYGRHRRGELLFTLIAFNLVIFLVAYLLNAVEMTMGAAFGLFAVFSMLRFRTEEIGVADMTYLFLSIALGLLMAVTRTGWISLAIIAVTLLAGAAILETRWFARRERSHSVLYDNLPLVAAKDQAALLEDLRTRTGLRIHRVHVREIDLLKDVAELRVYFFEE